MPGPGQEPARGAGPGSAATTAAVAAAAAEAEWAAARYELRGVVAHCGPSLGAGHYLAFVRRPGALPPPGQAQPAASGGGGPSSWLRIDDEDVRALSEEELRAELAGTSPSAVPAVPYVLLYGRRGAP